MKRTSMLAFRWPSWRRGVGAPRSTEPRAWRGSAFLTRLGGRSRQPGHAQLAARLLLVAILTLPQMVAPATILVDGNDSSIVAFNGVCSLREAINNANSNSDTTLGDCVAGDDLPSGGDTIARSVTPPFDGVVTLTVVDNGGYPDAGNGLPVISTDVTINGLTIARDETAPLFRILTVSGSGTLTLLSTTVSNGRLDIGASGNGGGIYNAGGTLTLTNSTVSGNYASELGGGILNFASSTATLTNSTVSGNYGGSGGGIYGGTLTLTNSTVSGNYAGTGGGIYNAVNATTLYSSTVSGNSASFGGGIYSGVANILTLINSTVSGNYALFGGGIQADEFSTTTLINSTVSGNYAANYGGSIFGYSTLYNSIVVGGGCSAGITGDGGNNFTDAAGCPGAPITDGVHIDTTLADNGGPTQTHALLGGSVAIDAAGACGLPTDQRGAPRDDGLCDSGAFEFGSSPPGGRDDDDGVPDEDDLCPNTGAGEPVDAAGCSDVQVDGDGDGVCDPGAPSDGPSGCTGSDNCPDDPNPDQTDIDGDGFGDECVPPGSIHPDADVGAGTTIGEGSEVKKGASVGENCQIGENSTIEKDASLGDNVVVGDGSTVAKETAVGDDVQIGNNVSIARNVIIEAGAIIGDNVTIGKDTFIGANATIGANSILGKEVTVAANAVVGPGSLIPNGATVP